MTNVKQQGMAFALAIALSVIVLFGAQSASALSTSLSAGASGSEVTELQSFLAEDVSIYPEGIISGYYGPLTVAAVQRFQCKQAIVCSGSAATTGYGRVGPATLAKINSLQGVSSVPGIPNTGGDAAAPFMTPETVGVSSTTAVIRWSTAEPALNSVLLGQFWPFYLGTAQSASSGIGMSANVIITGLQPNRTYHYVRQSVDMAGNVQWDFGGTFTTLAQ